MAVKVVVVLPIAAPAAAKLFTDDSQRVIDPVCPLNVNPVEFNPAQTAAVPAIEPPTDTGETVTVAVVLFAAAHNPLVTTAL